MEENKAPISVEDYTYAWRQCDYWVKKAEQFRNESQQWKASRNQAWKENAQLQNLLKQKQQKIQELERVISDFNLSLGLEDKHRSISKISMTPRHQHLSQKNFFYEINDFKPVMDGMDES